MSDVAKEAALMRRITELEGQLARMTSDRDAKSARMWELGHECDRLEDTVRSLRDKLDGILT